MEFIRNVKTIGTLTPDFVDAFEDFMPRWIESLVPFYEEGKYQNVEMVGLQNIAFFKEPTDNSVYEKDGIGYYLTEIVGLGKILEFNSNYKYQKINWLECFRQEYPELDNDGTKRITNFTVYSSYMSRLSNMKAPYDIVAQRADQYFRQITKDPSVGLSLGNTSFIYYSNKAKKYIDSHYYLD